jgi:hypothetical protein
MRRKDSRPAFVCGQLTADLNSGMPKPAHIFQIGQQVYHHSAGLPGGTWTGPHTILGLVWHSGGAVRYCIKSTTLVDESELKLALKPNETNE